MVRPRAKKVFRLLKRRDITADLVNQVIHIVWPDNQIWYAAIVNKVKIFARHLRFACQPRQHVHSPPPAAVICQGVGHLMECSVRTPAAAVFVPESRTFHLFKTSSLFVGLGLITLYDRATSAR